MTSITETDRALLDWYDAVVTRPAIGGCTPAVAWSVIDYLKAHDGRWPRQAEIAAKLRVSVDSVARALASLRREGFLELDPRDSRRRDLRIVPVPARRPA